MSNSKRNWAKFGVGVKLIVILRHIIAYFSINIRWHSQNVSPDSRKLLIKHLFPPSSCKKQINKQNSYLLLAFFQSGSVPELDMHVSKHVLPGQFVHSVLTYIKWRFLSSLFINRSFNTFRGCTKLRNEIETKRDEILRNATKYTKRRNKTQRNETKFTIMRNEMKWLQRNETKYTKVRNAIERNGI